MLSQTQERVVKHAVFWVLYLFLWWVLLDVIRGVPLQRATFRYLGCLLEIPFYYFHMYFLWPKLVDNKRYISYAICFLAVVIASAYTVRVWEFYVMFPILFEMDPPETIFKFSSVLGLSRSILLWFGPPTAIKLFRDWYQKKISLERAEKEQKISELNFLKSQMNPHFLFNTLNNLYALSIKKSPKISDGLLQLSDLLSYTLYEGSADKVSLEKEVAHLNDYIELEKLRFGDRLQLDLEISGNLGEVMIPPLVLIPLVENAFKHCSLNERGNVSIKVKIGADRSHFKVQTVNPVMVNGATKFGEHGGIGVKNLAKRLELLYPDKHDYTMNKENGQFIVNLFINLNQE